MDLILWRHAEAEEVSKQTPNDNARPLTAKGRQQAAAMAQWLNSVLPDHCKIIVSPAERTLQTVQPLNRPFEITSNVGPHSSVQQILQTCHWPNNKETVLVVSHQPHVGEIVSTLIPGIDYCEVKKGSVWWIGQKQSVAFLKAMLTPELCAVKK